MIDDIFKTFNNDKCFIKENGYKLVELDNEHAKMECLIKKSGLNPLGIAHGGLLFGLADSVAGALASMSGMFPLTVSSNINYLNSVKDGKIFAVATVLKQGKHMGYYDVKIYNEKDDLLCQATITMYFIKTK